MDIVVLSSAEVTPIIIFDVVSVPPGGYRFPS